MGSGASREVKVLIVGMGNAGKNTLMKYLRGRLGSDASSPLPSDSDLDVASVSFRGRRLQLWKLGGGRGVRPSINWRHHYLGTRACIVVVDATDTGGLGAVTEELRSLAADELVAGTVIVVLANKSDAEGAHSTAWLASTLQLQTMLVGHPWVIVPSCALTGAGVDEGLKFLVDNL